MIICEEVEPKSDCFLNGEKEMNPFQVNCSELIADFNIHNDEEIRNILTFLIEEYDIELYFEIKVSWQKEIFFKENQCLNIEMESIPFIVDIKYEQHYEYWIARCKDIRYLQMIIESIGKHQIQIYDEDQIIASSLIARNLINEIVALNPNYNQQIKDLAGKINFDEVFEVHIKIGNEKHLTTLCYGSNGYDDTLGWYFNAEHYERENYPFFEWAERSYNAKIRPFDGGKSDGYLEYTEKSDRERLRKKL